MYKKSLILLFFTCSLFCGATHAKECTLEITGNDVVQFNKSELKVPEGCKEVTLELSHSGKLPSTVMGQTGCSLK